MEQMIPVFLHDTFYLIQGMELQEVMTIANTEGLNSAKIRARAGFQANVDFYNSAMLKSHVSNMQMGFFEVGDKFIIKPISNINDLEYFIGPDGRKYTCEADYYNSPYRFVVDNHELTEEAAVEESTDEKRDKEDEAVVEVAAASTEEEQTVFFSGDQTSESLLTEMPKYIAQPEPAASVALIPVSQLTQETVEKRQERLEEAKFLDGLLSKQPHISTYIKMEYLSDVAAYLQESKDDLDREVKTPFLRDANVLNIIDGDLGTDTVENAVGSSNNMLDSLLTFPVFSALVGKKRLNERFSLLGLTGSQFVRICPVGVSPEGDLYGFVHMEEVSVAAVSKAESEIRQMLKDTGKNFNKLSSQEKYKLFEEKIAEFYSKNSGKMLRASGSQKYVNIVEFLGNMGGKKYTIPQVYDDEQGMILWPTHEIISFDNRGKKSLTEQLAEKYEATAQAPQVTQAEEAVAHRIIELPPAGARFVEPVEDEEVKDGEHVEPATIVLPTSPFDDDLFRMGVQSETSAPKEQGASLFDSIVNLSGTQKATNLTVHDSSGEVVEKISTDKKGARPVTPAKKPKLPGMLVDEVNVAMGGVNPVTPTKFTDEQGREWASKEARDQVLAAIFGAPEDETETVKKK